jgi:hypothetical protein
MKTKHWVIIILSLSEIAILAGRCSNSLTEKPRQLTFLERELMKNKKEVALNAELLVKKQLKSPRTAIFPPTSDYKVEITKDTIYVVESYVDAENSFGATIRRNWVVELKMIGDKKINALKVSFTN